MSHILRPPSSLPCASCVKQLGRVQSTRSFSSTNPQHMRGRQSQHRKRFHGWLDRKGEDLRLPRKQNTNYLGGYTADGKIRRQIEARAELDEEEEKLREQLAKNPDNVKLQNKLIAFEDKKTENLTKIPKAKPGPDMVVFPTNPDFVSEPVLPVLMKNEIYNDVKSGKTIRETSVKFGVEMSRVAAVYRLQEVEKEWRKQGRQPLYRYAETVMDMLPQTQMPLDKKAIKEIETRKKKNGDSVPKEIYEILPHESINDLPVHPHTGQQIFLPTSESRHFTRADAAKAFSDRLLPADKRVPHPELAKMHRDRLDGLTEFEINENVRRRREVELQAERDHYRRLRQEESKKVKKVVKNNTVFRFEEISAEAAGADGRGIDGVGWRYGAPLMDRAKGHVKIPNVVDRPTHQRQVDYGH